MTTPSPKDAEGNWDWSFSPKKSKGSSCVDRWWPSKTRNRERCPEYGLGRRRGAQQEGWPEGWTQSGQSMDIMIDNTVQEMTKEMDGKKGRREEMIALDRMWLLGTEHDTGSKTFDTNMERRLL